MNGRSPAQQLDADLTVALLLLAAGVLWVLNARVHAGESRRLVIEERGRRRDAEEQAETRRVQLDGALEQLHEAAAAREKAERDLAKAKAPAKRTAARRT